jgi:hypothetical protein
MVPAGKARPGHVEGRLVGGTGVVAAGVRVWHPRLDSRGPAWGAVGGVRGRSAACREQLGAGQSRPPVSVSTVLPRWGGPRGRGVGRRLAHTGRGFLWWVREEPEVAVLGRGGRRVPANPFLARGGKSGEWPVLTDPARRGHGIRAPCASVGTRLVRGVGTGARGDRGRVPDVCGGVGRGGRFQLSGPTGLGGRVWLSRTRRVRTDSVSRLRRGRDSRLLSARLTTDGSYRGPTESALPRQVRRGREAGSRDSTGNEPSLLRWDGCCARGIGFRAAGKVGLRSRPFPAGGRPVWWVPCRLGLRVRLYFIVPRATGGVPPRFSPPDPKGEIGSERSRR